MRYPLPVSYTHLAQSKLLGVTAVLRMGQGLTHSTHTHDDCDEIILVLNGEGSQLFQEEDGTEIRYDLHPDDLLYIAKNRVHRTDNLSKTDDLELFIINYFCDGQSDVHVKGFLPGACSTTQNILTPATCGSSTVNGESLTVAPGQTCLLYTSPARLRPADPRRQRRILRPAHRRRPPPW